MKKRTEKELVKGCKRFDKKAQNEVYDLYAPLLRAICSRYARDFSETEDILQEGLVKVFVNIKKFEWQGEGSFIGWMKRIVINAAITYYNKYKNSRQEQSLEDSFVDESKNEKLIMEESEEDGVLADVTGLSQENIISILQSIPEDFKVVFNLNIMEGYSHKEIAEMLNIKTETSRTRLLRAKNIVKKKILELNPGLAVDKK